MAGRWVLACVVTDPAHEDAQTALTAIPTGPLDEAERACVIFCANQGDPLLSALSKHRLMFSDAEAIAACGLHDPDEQPGRWLLFDPTLRVVAVWPLASADAALSTLRKTQHPDDHAGAPLNAPILIAPRVFEPAFCKSLIDYYNQRGGEASGVTRQDETGRTYVERLDEFKRRSDCLISDQPLRDAIMQRMYWRLAPLMERAFMWRPTRMERYLVARYDADGGGFFKPHRDNTTKGTAHRRFAVTINLNAGEYEGGDLRFPEFGSRTYRAPTGGAVVFACSLLHEATPVTRGQRYAFLPFLYDEDAAKVREANNKYLDESIRPYASGK